jgi:phenylacetate-CoA ligase
MFFQMLRRKLFWWADGLKGRSVQKHYADIEKIIENPNSSSSESQRAERLTQILRHAQVSVPRYATCDAAAGLAAFPVVDKMTIRADFEAFRSVIFQNKPTHRVVTSGSTGTPFEVLHDGRKKHRNTADTIFFAQKAGFELGQRLVYLKIWNAINRKNPLVAWMQNIEAQDVMQLSDENVTIFIEKIKKDGTPKGMLGYASAYEAVCRYLDRHPAQSPVHAHVRSAIAMSEGLSAYARAAMRQHFGVDIVSRYSNVENGIIAQQWPGHGPEFYVNTASYVVEILDLERDAPVADGTLGRIVVTDLFNYAMPLLRYDTGDVGALGKVGGRQVLTQVEGRRMDQVFNTSGDLVSSFTITNQMWKYAEIRQYQFIQKDRKNYLFRLNLIEKFNRVDELIHEFRQYFGADADIRIEYVDEIPLLASGKRKKVVNEYRTT